MKTNPCLFAVVPLFLLAVSNCGPQTRSQVTTAVNLRYPETRYVLPTPETERFRKEASRAKRAGNREVCGTLLLSKKGTLALCFSDNDSHAPHSFQISHDSLRKMNQVASMTNSEIIGSFHSHPSGIAEPGVADLHGEAVDNLMMIHSCLTGKTRLWRVAMVDGKREAQEIPLEVQSRRFRSASPLAPSRSMEGPDRDVRSLK